MARKKQPPRTPTTPSPSPTLALSELHLRAEALEKEHQSLLKKIKRKRTEVKNFAEQMREVATQIFHRGTPIFEKQTEINREVHAIFEEILTKRKLGKKTRQDIIGIYETLQIGGLISPKSLDSETDSEADSELDELFESDHQEDNFSDRFTDNHHQEQTSITAETARTEESRKIRQMFLKLAEIFHPDKVTDSETQMRHTEIMKELNKAYQDGDLAKLLEIEKQHQAGESIDYSSEDDLTRKCKILEQQNSILKNQYENLKKELRLVKNTPEGALVSEFRQASRLGINPMDMFLQQMEKEIKVMQEIRDFVRDFRDQKMTIKEFLKGPACMVQITQSLREKMLEELFGISIEDFDF